MYQQKQKTIAKKFWVANDETEILFIPLVNGELPRDMFRDDVTLEMFENDGYFTDELSREQKHRYAEIVRKERVEMLISELCEYSDDEMIKDEILNSIDLWC